MNDHSASFSVFDLSGKQVFVAGHRGMVGSAIVRRLARCSCDVVTASRQRVDLLRQDLTESFLRDLRPQVVIVAERSRRYLCERYFPRGVHLRKSGDRGQCYPRRVSG